MYKDLRDFVESVEQLGALRRIDRADPQFEIGAITEVAAGRPGGPALLYDIKGFPRGFRILTNAMTSVPRAALALGLDPSMRPLDALKRGLTVERNPADARRRHRNDHRIGGEIASGSGLRNR